MMCDILRFSGRDWIAALTMNVPIIGFAFLNAVELWLGIVGIVQRPPTIFLLLVFKYSMPIGSRRMSLTELAFGITILS